MLGSVRANRWNEYQSGMHNAGQAAVRWLDVERSTNEGRAILVLSLSLNLLLAYLLAVRLSLLSPDAMWRMTHAWLVLFGGNSLLFAVASVSPPLPALLQLPLELLPQFRGSWLSGSVLAAASAALASVVLSRILADWNIGRCWRYPMLALFSLNPLILLYSGSGSSELITLILVVLTVYFLLDWYRTDSLQPLTSLGLALGLTSLARPEGLFFALPVLGAVWLLRDYAGRHSPGRFQGLLIVCFMPVMFIVGAWILSDLLITEDLSHFVQGAYSGADRFARQSGDVLTAASASGDANQAAGRTVELFLSLFPFFAAGLALLLGDYILTRNRLSLSLAILALTFPALLALSSFAGGNVVSPRSFILAVPFGFIMAGQIMSRIIAGTANRVVRLSVCGILLAALAASTISSGAVVVRSMEPGQWNALVEALNGRVSAYSWQEEREIAGYLLDHVGDRQVLVDHAAGYPIIFFTGHPEVFVAESAASFQSALRAPAGQVGYVLARASQTGGTSMAGNRQSMSLYNSRDYSTLLVREWPPSGWRLYQVVEPGGVSDSGG